MAVRGWPRLLAWGNFRVRASAPPGVSEDAQTEASIEPPARVKVVPDGGQLRLDAFDVTVRLVPLGTWVVRGKATTALLAHEQGHWDIAGLTAHEYHRALAGLRAASQSELARLAQNTLQHIQGKVDGLQEKYDRETKHSKDAAAQTRWATLIRGCIASGNRALPDP